MSEEELEELREYILSDPDGLGIKAMAEAGNDAGILEAITDPVIETGDYVDRATLEIFLNGEGIAAIAEIVGEDPETPFGLRVACLTLGKVLASKEFPGLDLANPKTVGMANGLIAGGVMTQAQFDALCAIAQPAKSSHAAAQGWLSVSVDDVSKCLVGHRGG